MLIQLRTARISRWIVLLVMVALAGVFIPQPAVRASVFPEHMKEMKRMPSTSEGTGLENDPDQRTRDMEVIRRELNREAVKNKLAVLGFTPDEIEQRLNRLSDRQIHRMAQRIEYVRTGGHDPDWTPPDHPVLLIIFIILLPIIAVVWILVWLFHTHDHAHLAKSAVEAR